MGDIGHVALFAGPSGTGKTMAAQIVAKELGVELFQVDLARTVSKYIGETEKNLDRVFKAAAKTNAVLLFDKADALFGKRSDVRDGHDRYANIDAAHLLRRLEKYPGMAVILVTNSIENMDEAFLRRTALALEFPVPDSDERLRLWAAKIKEAKDRSS